MSVALPLRIAAVLFWVTAVFFGLLSLLSIRNLLAGQQLPVVLGIPVYGGGPFEHYTTTPLVAGFLLVSILEGVAGWLIFGGRKAGAILGLVLLPAGAVYWWGWALPGGPIFAIPRTILIVIRWSGLD
jgi:hypothetical protein